AAAAAPRTTRHPATAAAERPRTRAVGCRSPGRSRGELAEPDSIEQLTGDVIGFDLDRESRIMGEAGDGKRAKRDAALDASFSLLCGSPESPVKLQRLGEALVEASVILAKE